MRDLFQIQDELVARIVSALQLPLTARDHRLLRRDTPASATAYELYLRANELTRDRNQVRVVRDLYRQCLELDPGYAPAWRNLPVALHQAGRTDEALAAAREAVSRFPRDVEARVTLATILRGLGSREEALATLAPVRGDARAALRTALLLAELGRRQDALEAVRSARPLSPEPGFQAQLDGLEARLR